MEKRFVLFLVLSLLLFVGYGQFLKWWAPPRPRPPVAAVDGAAADPNKPADAAENAAEKPADGAAAPAADPTTAQANPAAPADGTQPPAQPEAEAPAQPGPGLPAQPVVAERHGSLGTLDPTTGGRLLVTWTNRGAAIERIELSDPHYLDQEDRSGYLGHLDAIDNPAGAGALLQVVGPGTPAAIAGLQAGDIVDRVDETQIDDARDLEVAIGKTRPKQKIKIRVQRGGKENSAEQTFDVALIRRPLEVIRPEDLPEVEALWERLSPDVIAAADNIPSLLLTLEQLNGQRLKDDALEIPGVNLEKENWEVVEGANDSEVAFRRRINPAGIEIIKRFRLAPPAPAVAGQPAAAGAARDYHLEFEIEIHNRGSEAHEVAYRLFGPNGLPTEGWWYASKISRNWGGAGPRDVVYGVHDGQSVDDYLVTCGSLSGGKPGEILRGMPLSYVGVDTQYFAAVLMPQKDQALDDWFYEWQPIIAGPLPKQSDKKRLANTSLRLTSQKAKLDPEKSITQRYVFFAGPKKPVVLDQYALGELNYYGLFGWVAKPLARVLHFFATVPGINFGIAIVLLTVLVRGSMFPLGRRQAASAAKMQLLQPEIKRLNEKYKTDMEGRAKAQRELFAKHGYNPLSGCLPLVVQMPIFIGLYRSLSVDLELRGAPLLWDGAWASNLAAPDKMYHWLEFMPQFVLGWLGPYFNMLPLITIALFIVQQKMFMPPPTDEQAAMQQKMMQYMMIFMGVMFFKVPSGLCVYFIASSLWGLAERKLVPKPGATPPAEQPPSENRVKAALAGSVSSNNGGGAKNNAGRAKNNGGAANGNGAGKASKQQERGKPFAALLSSLEKTAWGKRAVELFNEAQRNDSRRSQ
jgi:YidC/Oxa1 family membrane protein insertase